MSRPSHEARALQLVMSREFAQAAKEYAKALVKQESGELWNDWATCQFHAGRFDEAEEGYRQALELDGGNPHVAANLGLFLHRQGRPSEARPWLEKVVHRLPVAAREPIAIILAEYRQELAASHPGSASPAAFLQNMVGDSLREKAYFEARLVHYLEILKALPDALPGQRLLEVGARFHHLTPAFCALKGYEVRCAANSPVFSQSIAQVIARDGSQQHCFTVDKFDLQSRWPYPDEAFDVVTCCGILEDLAGDPEKLLSEANRVLKPTGLLMVTASNRSSQAYVRRRHRLCEPIAHTAANENAPSSNSLVCLQSMWRSGGTYLWSKFRGAGKFRTYDEPCHERLLTAKPELFEKEKGSGITHQLRHPELDSHYFAEFPFQEKGGVELFRKRFSFEDYYLPEHAKDRELETYVENLVAKAHQCGQRPLAKFCRFGLRAAWLKRHFAPISIYVLRNPDAMFRSYWSLGGRESYFFAGMLLITSKNQKLPIFQEFAEEYDIPFIEQRAVEDELTEAHKLLQSLDHQSLRDLFLLHWALTYEHNAAISDYVLDIDLLATNKRYRSATEGQLSSLLAFPIRFDDVKYPRSGEAPGVVASPWAIAAVRRALGFLPSAGGKNGKWEISTQSESVLHSLYSSEATVPDESICEPVWSGAGMYSPDEIRRFLATSNFSIAHSSTSLGWPAYRRRELLSFMARGTPIAHCGDQILCLARKSASAELSARGPDSNRNPTQRATSSAPSELISSPVRLMRVLVIHEQPLQPTRNGSDVRLLQLLREFRAQGHDVTFMARSGDNPEEAAQSLRDLGIHYLFHDSGRLRCFGKDDPVRWQFEEVVTSGSFDLAILTLWFWRSISIPEHYLDEIRRCSPQTRIAVLTDDQHGLRERRMAELSKAWHDYERAKDHAARESEIYERADVVLSISEDDRRGLLRSNPGLSIDLLPMIAEPAAAGPGFQQRKDFLFVGNFGNLANTDAVRWLLQEAWPEVRRRMPSAMISLVGNHLPLEFAKARDGIQAMGHIADLEPLFEKHRVFAAPIRFGTGIKTKNLSALAHGLPLVTTTIGAEGLNLQNGTHALIADSAEAFAHELCRCYVDEGLWRTLAHEGRTHVQVEFGHEKLRQAVQALTQKVASATPQPYDATHEFSCRLVESKFPEVLADKPASYRRWLRLWAHASLAEELVKRGEPANALKQIRHMFSIAEPAAYDLALFRRVRELMSECCTQIPEMDDTKDLRNPVNSNESHESRIAPACVSRPIPRISVIIPTYNRKSVLRACLSHLASQSVPKEQWEIVVVDDGSTDGTEEIMRQAPRFCQIEYVRQRHAGAGAARRAGIESARGEFILLLKDDSTPYDNLLTEHLRLHLGNRDKKIAVLGGRSYSREAAQTAITFFLAGNPLFFSQAMVPGGVQNPGQFFFGHNLSVPRETVLQVGSFDAEFRSGDDIELGIRLASAGYHVHFHPQAGSDHNHLNVGVAELLQKARTCGKVQWQIVRKHRQLLGDGTGPFGMLDQAARRRIHGMLKQTRPEVRESLEELKRLSAFDFTPYLTNELRSRYATEVLARVKTLVPKVFWFEFFEGALEMWEQGKEAHAGQRQMRTR